jgi:hypothetical protein
VDAAGRLAEAPEEVGATPAPLLGAVGVDGPTLAGAADELPLAGGLEGAGVWTFTRTTRVRVRQRTITRGLRGSGRLCCAGGAGAAVVRAGAVARCAAV